MPFRPPKKPVQFADLKGILAQTRETENPLYQTVGQIIDRLTQFQGATTESLASVTSRVDVIDGGGGGTTPTPELDQTFLTTVDETDTLENSVRLLAGTNITFDDSVPNIRTINASISGSGAYAPMSTGAEPLEIMSNGAGQVLMVGFSE